MAKTDDLLQGLVAWCESQRDIMTRQNDLMKSRRMRCGTSDGHHMVDDMPSCIKENERRIAELNKLLANIAAGAI